MGTGSQFTCSVIASVPTYAPPSPESDDPQTHSPSRLGRWTTSFSFDVSPVVSVICSRRPCQPGVTRGLRVLREPNSPELILRNSFVHDSFPVFPGYVWHPPAHSPVRPPHIATYFVPRPPRACVERSRTPKHQTLPQVTAQCNMSLPCIQQPAHKRPHITEPIAGL